MKKLLIILLSAALLLSVVGCKEKDTVKVKYSSDAVNRILSEHKDAHVITLDKSAAALDGKSVNEYDYVWKYDPSLKEPILEGDEPNENDDCYIAHDIVYYPKISAESFAKETYDGETEWVTRFTNAELTDYIFATLPVLGSDLPTDMMHEASEAYSNPVLHIKKAGEYIIYGDFNGQILIDLGDSDETFTDKSAAVTLIMAGADIACTVAPAVVFYSAYECDNKWEERTEYGNNVDLTDAGAKVILADGTENNVTGSNVYRLLKPKYKSDDTKVQKKLYKTDGAFYSFVSMSVDGETDNTGILNVKSTTYEGLDSELHLTLDGGYINIFSQDDGINVNEDNVSVLTVNDGHLTIFAGLGAEGDVIDSNGYITLNGGIIAGCTPSPSDDILDCDCQKFISENATVINGSANQNAGGVPNNPNGAEPPDRMTPPDRMANDNAQPPTAR